MKPLGVIGGKYMIVATSRALVKRRAKAGRSRARGAARMAIRQEVQEQR